VIVKILNPKRELTSLPVPRYRSGHRKGRLKILSMNLSDFCEKGFG
jgi:hypothetical protein